MGNCNCHGLTPSQRDFGFLNSPSKRWLNATTGGWGCSVFNVPTIGFGCGCCCGGGLSWGNFWTGLGNACQFGLAAGLANGIMGVFGMGMNWLNTSMYGLFGGVPMFGNYTLGGGNDDGSSREIGAGRRRRTITKEVKVEDKDAQKMADYEAKVTALENKDNITYAEFKALYDDVYANAKDTDEVDVTPNDTTRNDILNRLKHIAEQHQWTVDNGEGTCSDPAAEQAAADEAILLAIKNANDINELLNQLPANGNLNADQESAFNEKFKALINNLNYDGLKDINTSNLLDDSKNALKEKLASIVNDDENSAERSNILDKLADLGYENWSVVIKDGDVVRAYEEGKENESTAPRPINSNGNSGSKVIEGGKNIILDDNNAGQQTFVKTDNKGSSVDIYQLQNNQDNNTQQYELVYNKSEHNFELKQKNGMRGFGIAAIPIKK